MKAEDSPVGTLYEVVPIAWEHDLVANVYRWKVGRNRWCWFEKRLYLVGREGPVPFANLASLQLAITFTAGLDAGQKLGRALAGL